MGGFDDVEKQGGVVVTDYSQRQIVQQLASESANALGTAQPTDASTVNGVCQALSTLWIIRSANEDDFWSILDRPETLAFVKQGQHTEHSAMKVAAAALGMSDKLGNFDQKTVIQGLALGTMFGSLSSEQKAAVDLATKAKAKWSPNQIMESTGMGQSFTPKVDDKVELARALTKQEGYSLLSVQFANEGHAMALYNSPGRGVQFMDSNYGEVMFTDTGKFERWFIDHISSYEKSFGDARSLQHQTFKNPSPPRRPELKGNTLTVVAEQVRQAQAAELANAEAQLAGLANFGNGRELRKGRAKPAVAEGGDGQGADGPPNPVDARLGRFGNFANGKDMRRGRGHGF